MKNPKNNPISALRRLAIAVSALLLTSGGVALGGSLAANWMDNSTTDALSPEEVAGAPGFTQAYWNNFERWSGGQELLDNTGQNTGVIVAWDANNTWRNGSATDTPDGRLMHGYLDSTGGANNNSTPYNGWDNANKPDAWVRNLSAWLTAQGACSYDVVVYTSGDTSGRRGEFWLQNVTGSDFGNLTLGTDLTAHRFNRNINAFAGYVAVPFSATSLANATTGNYIVFTNLSADTFLLRIEDTHDTRAVVNGLQIWPHLAGVPLLNSVPGPRTNNAGQVASFTVSASGCGAQSYQWRKAPVGGSVFTPITDGGNFSGATTATLVISNLAFADAADYVVVVSNATGSSTSAPPATLTVVPATITDLTPTAARLFPGATLRLQGAATGAAPLSYQWFKDGAPLVNNGNIQGATTNQLLISNVTAAQTGAYALVVTTTYGSVTSSVVPVSLMAAPSAGSFAQAVASQQALAYWPLGETVGPVAYDPIGSFNGKFGAASLLAQTGPRPPDFTGFAGDNAGFGVSVTANAWATVPALNLNTNTVSIVAWLYPNGIQQAWTGIFMTRSGTEAGLGFRDGPNELGFTWNNNSTWQYASGLNLPSDQWSMVALVISPANATLYLGNPNVGLVSKVVVLACQAEAWSGPSLIGDDQDGTGRAFNGTIDEVAVFKRSLSATDITALYAAGRASGVLAPAITAQPDSLQLYPGRTATFSVAASGTPPLSYQWRKASAPLSNGGNVSGASTATLSLANVSAADAASYQVIISNAGGSVTSSVVSLALASAPTPNSYAAKIVAANPSAYWRLSEVLTPPLANAFDSIGGHAAYYGSVAAGGTGPAAPEFPGFESQNPGLTTYPNTLGSWVTASPLNWNTNTVTFTAWIYSYTDRQTNAGIFYQREGLTTAGLSYDNFDGTRLGYNWANDSAAYNFDSGLYLPVNQWTFVAVVVEPTRATLYMATNGVLRAAVNPLTHINQPFAGMSYIGNDPLSSTGARIFNGIIDEVALFNRSLSGEEIASLYTVASSLNLAPQISQQPAERFTYVGQSASLQVAAAGTGPLRYQWLKNGSPVAGGTAASLGFAVASLADSGNYSVVVSNSFGSVTSSAARLTVLETAARIVWSAPVPITSAEATLGLPGALAGAAVFAGGDTAVTLSSGLTLTFKANGSVASTTGNGTGNTAFLTNSTGNTNFDAVLNQYNYDGGPKTITLKGLTPGHPYSVQLFGLDDRDTGAAHESSRRAYFQDPYDPSNVSATFYMSNNVFVVGTFTASGLTQTLRMVLPGWNGGEFQLNNGNLNALVIRDQSPLPAFSSQPTPMTRFVGMTASFTVTTYGPSPMTWRWQKGNGGSFVDLPISGSIVSPVPTQVSLSLPNLAAIDAGDYRLVVSNSSGSSTSQAAALTVVVPSAGSYDAAVLSYRPISYWRLNETAGSFVAQDYLAGNDALSTNVTFGVAGPVSSGLPSGNTAAAYNGTTSASSTSVSLANNLARFSMVGWFKMADAPLARSGLFGQNDVLEFGFHNTSSIGIWSPTGGYLETSIANLVYNQWYHLAVVGDGAAFQIYLDGVLQASGGNVASTYGTSSSPFRIGGGGILDNSGNSFNGSLDEVALFNYALSAEDVLNLYQAVGAPTLTIARSGNQVLLTWPQGTLLEADELSGSWKTNTATSPYLLTPTGARKFYRLQLR